MSILAANWLLLKLSKVEFEQNHIEAVCLCRSDVVETEWEQESSASLDSCVEEEEEKGGSDPLKCSKLGHLCSLTLVQQVDVDKMPLTFSPLPSQQCNGFYFEMKYYNALIALVGGM